MNDMMPPLAKKYKGMHFWFMQSLLREGTPGREHCMTTQTMAVKETSKTSCFMLRKMFF